MKDTVAMILVSYKLRKFCTHDFREGIYGDKINFVGGYRLQCIICGSYLKGPVSEANI